MHDNNITQSGSFAAGIVRASNLGNSVYNNWNNHFQNDNYTLSNPTGKYFVWFSQLQTKAWWEANASLH